MIRAPSVLQPLRRHAPHLLAVGCALGVLAGCGGGAGSSPSTGPPRSAGTAGLHLGTPSKHVAATDQLVFAPATLTLRVGDIVQWTNTGTVPHTVTFDNQPSLTDPSVLAPGETWEAKLDQPGTFFYYCSLHPGMSGKLVVTPRTATLNGR